MLIVKSWALFKYGILATAWIRTGTKEGNNTSADEQLTKQKDFMNARILF